MIITYWKFGFTAVDLKLVTSKHTWHQLRPRWATHRSCVIAIQYHSVFGCQRIKKRCLDIRRASIPNIIPTHVISHNHNYIGLLSIDAYIAVPFHLPYGLWRFTAVLCCSRTSKVAHCPSCWKTSAAPQTTLIKGKMTKLSQNQFQIPQWSEQIIHLLVLSEFRHKTG